MPEKPLPTEKEVMSWIRDRSNWGRWGKDDQRGAINLITPAKRVAAARLVHERAQRLAEPAVPQGAGDQQRAARAALHADAAARQGRLRRRLLRHLLSRRRLHPHRRALPHLGRATRCGTAAIPRRRSRFDGARVRLGRALAGGHHHPRACCWTCRGIAASRRDPGPPVHGWELDDILEPARVKLEPGDAVCRLLRDARPGRRPIRSKPYGRPFGPRAARAARAPRLLPAVPARPRRERAGVGHAGSPADRLRHPVGGARRASSPTAARCSTTRCWSRWPQACEEEERDEFMLIVAPLPVMGGTGSPANPLAMF